MAGAVIGTIDRAAARNHPQFRVKLVVIGFGFLVGAGLPSAVIFPVVALTLAGRNEVELANTAVA